MATASSLIVYTATLLTFVAFRFYLAALRAHDLIDDSKKSSSSCKDLGGCGWAVSHVDMRVVCRVRGKDVEG